MGQENLFAQKEFAGRKDGLECVGQTFPNRDCQCISDPTEHLRQHSLCVCRSNEHAVTVGNISTCILEYILDAYGDSAGAEVRQSMQT